MYLSENDARTKICPFDIPQSNTCVASDCMAWRWYQDFTKYGEKPPKERGWCGLAGDPYPVVMADRNL
jgi:hypothetical protein